VDNTPVGSEYEAVDVAGNAGYDESDAALTIQATSTPSPTPPPINWDEELQRSIRYKEMYKLFEIGF